MFRRLPLVAALGVLVALPLPAAIRTLTILHTNDIHSRLSPLENGRGGFAYLAAYIECIRWVRAPANKAQGMAILVDKLKLSTREAERTHQLLLDPAFGFTPDAAFDRDGFKNVLALRAELERKAGTAVPAPERYVDLSYYEAAMRLVGR